MLWALPSAFEGVIYTIIGAISMTIRILESITEVTAESWNALVADDFPFTSHAFLHALESTRCLGQRTGWAPTYLSAWNGPTLVGAMVLFVKTNSYGEYIFDFAWANAHENLGLHYYPKQVSAIPFTPATGSKILLSPVLNSGDRAKISRLLIQGALELGLKFNASSFHALFVPQDEVPVFENAGLFTRHSYQFHWRNNGYTSFTDFLNRLRSKRRGEILRERRQALESGVQISRLTGASLTPAHADIMYRFYLSTIDKRQGHNYLTLDFFKKVFATMSDRILLNLATNAAGTPVAGALNYFGGSSLFGRNWGCLEEYKALHFELCYYQGIEFAIERGLELFEAGAQGEHKFQRGFLPTLTYSAHHVADPRLCEAIIEFVENEKRQITALFTEYGEHTPFARREET
jgi:uncharacterized protein